MAAPDPQAVISRAKWLAAQLGSTVCDQLCDNPQAVIIDLGIGVDDVPVAAGGCGLDGSYDPKTNTIRIDPTAIESRRRFTLLHELGHKLIDDDVATSDWLWTLGDAQDHAVEAVADAFAAEILLPEELVGAALPREFRARQVAELAAIGTASREAVVVRAAQRLGGPGIVVLARDLIVQFSSARSLQFRIGRGVEQPAGSVFDVARQHGRGSVTGTPIQLRRAPTFMTFDGDAYLTDDGYTFAVLRPSPPDLDRDGKEWGGSSWRCPSCDDDITDGDWCDSCSRKICTDCGCRCGPPRRAAKSQLCPVHFITLPASGICDYCE